MTYSLVARCTDSQSDEHIEALEALHAEGTEVSAETFFRHVSLKDVSRMLGYAYGCEHGLHLKNDYAVRYYRSRWQGAPCYHMDWSAIDHIFADPRFEPVAQPHKVTRGPKFPALMGPGAMAFPGGCNG